jgi:DNA-binding transcriptional ArsR family regulator
MGDGPDDSGAKLPSIPKLEPDIYKVLGHQLRFRIFWRLSDSKASAGAMAREFGEPEQQIRDQIKVLKKYGLVELAETKSGEKGGRCYIYRAADRLVVGADEWAALPPAIQDSSEIEITRKLQGEMVRALEARTLQSDPDHVLIRRPGWFDRQAKREVDAIMCEALARIIEAERGSAERCAQSGERPIRMITGMTSFAVAPGDSAT